MKPNFVEEEHEIELSKKRCEELWDKNIINTFEVGTWKGLQQIHKYIFQDVFDFAGEMRKVNIAKNDFMFAPLMFLEENLNSIDKMPENTFDEIIEKYVEMNIAHPFREGNGRSTRIWLDLILKKRLNLVVNWEFIDKNYYLAAMIRSSVNPAELKSLLKKHLTDKVNDRTTFMKGIAKSYEYEGYYIKI
ncbi:protein adenylyltransferase Fic [Mycoplasma sp. HU2014]|uniref:protein adenylyltransferase Fic n=1 Tax=Mycoplasma sp. HU2014 TaxID=1664275 RepID=UPI00067C93B0|nr:Fic family protein [Mycoplasma sp. HU2014]KNG79528.1 Fic family protein [Mycoplasma sp. HU2014]